MDVLTNDDVLGVIGRIGTLFGTHGINIAGVQLGRQRPGGRAVSILSLHTTVSDPVLGELRALPSIRSARLVAAVTAAAVAGVPRHETHAMNIPKWEVSER
jgi:D-3-phosphoglycerate dehydrogenase